MWSAARPLVTVEPWVEGKVLRIPDDAGYGAVTEPLDLVRTRLMAQKPPQQAAAAPVASGAASSGSAGVARSFGYTGVYHGLRSAAMTDGVAALWRGLLPRLVLKSVGSSVWYTVYMASRRHLAQRREAEA